MENYNITTRDEMVEAVAEAGPDWINIINLGSCKFPITKDRCLDLETLTRNYMRWPDLIVLPADADEEEPYFVDFPVRLLYRPYRVENATHNIEFHDRDSFQCSFCDLELECQLKMFDHIYDEHKKPTAQMLAWRDSDRRFIKSKIIFRKEQLEHWRADQKRKL